ncbi:unnamed protein product [Cuscuta epithymum]|uniref:F-box domain-containing protein n=2 Tax=Cuscuta epithymum TaxID=186058 RepID=A0AAV0F6H9_9ASTE|nr:unnamed protein product [Cuscuta epithymum]
MSGNRVLRDSRFQLKKCAAQRLDINDRISHLPDDILGVILSSLPLKEAGRTSVLSSRWKNLWKQTPRLNFNACNELDRIARDGKLRCVERCKYVRWVNSVLKSVPRKAALTLEHFRICFDVGKAFSGTITKWLKFAFKRQVERLELNLLEYGDHASEKSYVFPEDILFQNSSDFPHQTTTPFNFHSLKALCLKNVSISDKAIEFLLRNCPSLEQLDLQDIYTLSNLEVCGPSLVLKNLSARYCYDLVSIKVSAPNLTSLAVSTPKGLVLENVPMLVDLNISCREAHIPLLVPTLSCCFSQLEILTLRLPIYEVYDIVRFNFPEMVELKKVVVSYAGNHDESLLGLMTFIRISPKLEEFVLKNRWCDGLSRARRELNKGAPFRHQNLKVFQYLGYYGRCSDMEVVVFILENCIGLQQIIIDPTVQTDFLHEPLDPGELEQEEVGRSYAKEQLKPIIPPHIQFVIR